MNYCTVFAHTLVEEGPLCLVHTESFYMLVGVAKWFEVVSRPRPPLYLDKLVENTRFNTFSGLLKLNSLI